MLKALADDSRYAIFAELSRSEEPLSTLDLAQRLELHPNTVRLHLERLREVGMVQASTEGHGLVGRPQHHWALSPDAPAVGIRPDGSRVLAHLLAEALAGAAPGPEQLLATGRRAGATRARAASGRTSRVRGRQSVRRACLDAVLDELGDLGFDPVTDGAGDAGPTTAVTFTRCPFRELATAYPDLVCALHRGITEGILASAAERVAGMRAEVTAFGTLVDEDPCRAELTLAVD